MDKEQERLVLENKKLVYFVAKRMKNSGYYIDEDVIQSGFLGLCYAVKRYDPEKGMFSTFAVPYIQVYIKKCCYNNYLNSVNFLTELDKPIKNVEEYITIKDLIEDKNDCIEKVLTSIYNKQMIKKLLSYLDGAERKILLKGIPNNWKDFRNFKRVHNKIKVLYGRESL